MTPWLHVQNDPYIVGKIPYPRITKFNKGPGVSEWVTLPTLYKSVLNERLYQYILPQRCIDTFLKHLH